MKLMQEKSETFLNFTLRTDHLASLLGVPVEGLIPELGMSRSSLFSYRTGNRPISRKAWIKLEAAEKRAGIEYEIVSKKGTEEMTLVAPSPSKDDLNPYLCENILTRLIENYHPVSHLKMKEWIKESSINETELVFKIILSLKEYIDKYPSYKPRPTFEPMPQSDEEKDQLANEVFERVSKMLNDQ